MHGNVFWLIQAEIGSIEKWYLLWNIISSLQPVDLAGRLKPIRQMVWWISFIIWQNYGVLSSFKKSEKNSEWPDATHPTIHFFFGNMYNNKKQLKNTPKKEIISPQFFFYPSWGLIFSDFSIF